MRRTYNSLVLISWLSLHGRGALDRSVSTDKTFTSVSVRKVKFEEHEDLGEKFDLLGSEVCQEDPK